MTPSTQRSSRFARFWIATDARVVDEVAPMYKAPVIIKDEWRADLFRPDAAWDLHGPFVPEEADDDR